MSERRISLSVKERDCYYVEIILMSWGFYSFGTDSISEEVAGFSPLCFPRGKLFVSLVSCDVLVFYCCACYSLSEKILRS